ncbi:MAG TPA: hypothetical protein VKZ50_01425 [bacterium]|nr:hypothetical protein [bacterium]
MRDVERDRLLRHGRKAQRLDEPVPVCLGCGCASVEALTGVPFRSLPVWVQRRIIERHHPRGRVVDPEWVVPLCRSCHAVASDRWYDLPAEVRAPTTDRERAVAVLLGVADWLRTVTEGAGMALVRVEEVATLLLAVDDEEGTR